MMKPFMTTFCNCCALETGGYIAICYVLGSIIVYSVLPDENVTFKMWLFTVIMSVLCGLSGIVAFFGIYTRRPILLLPYVFMFGFFIPTVIVFSAYETHASYIKAKGDSLFFVLFFMLEIVENLLLVYMYITVVNLYLMLKYEESESNDNSDDEYT